MANRKRSSTVSWINVKLSDTDKDYLKNNNPDAAEMLEAVDTLTLNGYSFNIKCQDDDTVIVMVFRQAVDDEGTTLGCSAFANEFEFALHVLLYKLLVRLDGQWTKDLSDTNTGSKASFG